MSKKLKKLVISGSEENLEEAANVLEKQDFKTIKIFGDPFIIEE